MTPTTLQRIERIVWTAGIACLATWGGLRASGSWMAAQDVARFTASVQGPNGQPIRPDTSLWSPLRIRAWEDSLAKDGPSVLAVLRIPKIKLEVAVLKGTDDWTLNRAVGHIEDTALPGTVGNIGIAGHRDSFFRGLKDLVVGDALHVALEDRTERYLVSHIWIVKPEDVWVIDPTNTPALTLVTCYPFYFVGSAPQRYIVRAVPDPAGQ